jgi:hypothetical protein
MILSRDTAGTPRWRLALGLAAVALAVAAGPAVADDPSAPDALGTPEPCDDPAIATLATFDCSGIDPVPSLDPAESAVPAPIAPALAARAAITRQGAAASLPPYCRFASEVIYYTQRDWRRLAQTLVGDASPCANFYIDIPPIVPPNNAPKLQPRASEPPWIHALAPTVHALNEVHLASWSRWRIANNATWFQAGVTARQAMDAAGFSVLLGDLWAVNEIPSTVRRGDGTARSDLIDFLHGLYDANGTAPPSKGVVYASGIAQGTQPTSVYKGVLENWLQDQTFWAGMASYVRFFAQEVYPDSRTWGVASAPRAVRAAHFSDYLEHLIRLADAGPDSVATARDFLRQAYLPLASTAWRWTDSYGFTDMTDVQMEQFVSEETYAIRFYAGSHPQDAPQGRYGSAWAPNNLNNQYDAATFLQDTQGVLDRVASALHHAYDFGGGSPAGACGPPGDHEWCDANVDGAAFTEGWAGFNTWS